MMHIKKILYLLVLVQLSACIKPYEPELKDDSTQKYVVQGMISSVEGYQEINVSLTSAVNQPHYIGLNGCLVEILDDQNNTFTLDDNSNGNYKVWIDQAYLQAGRSYKTRITTPNGDILESVFERMPLGPNIDDVYYEIENQPTNNPDIWYTGLQLYTNLVAHEQDSKFYKWKLIETWEYHAAHPKEFYYDGQINQISPPDFSQKYCWTTLEVAQIFTLSIKNLSNTTYNKYPLNFVANNTSRLAILYSLLVEQMALTENAYTYWDQLRQNSEQDGGLYTSQPMAIKGNLVNISHPEKQVLGYFQASTLKIQRIFIEPEMNVEFNNGCAPTLLEHGLVEISPDMYPAYLENIDGYWSLNYLNEACVDCTVRGGTTEKPNYWPSK